MRVQTGYCVEPQPYQERRVLDDTGGGRARSLTAGISKDPFGKQVFFVGVEYGLARCRYGIVASDDLSGRIRDDYKVETHIVAGLHNQVLQPRPGGCIGRGSTAFG